MTIFTITSAFMKINISILWKYQNREYLCLRKKANVSTNISTPMKNSYSHFISFYGDIYIPLSAPNKYQPGGCYILFHA